MLANKIHFTAQGQEVEFHEIKIQLFHEIEIPNNELIMIE
jgi:hypothetical protein